MQPTGKALCHISVKREPAPGIRIMVSGWIHLAHVYRGDVSSAVLLYDAEYIWIHDLEITNKDHIDRYSLSQEKLPVKQDTGDGRKRYSAPHKMDRTGVAVVAQKMVCFMKLFCRNLMIHDVDGNVYNKHMNNGGIYMTALKLDNEEQQVLPDIME